MDSHGGEITEIEVQVLVSDAGANNSPNATIPKKKLLHLASWGEWRQVVEICRESPSIVGEKIFSNEETILHVAVADDQPKALRTLVEIVTDEKILETANEMGNTLLHLAAATGNTGIAHYLIGKRKELIKIRNNDKQTPLYVAALHGKKDTFLCLLSKCPPDEGIVYWRGCEGNSVLHAAILGENFGVVIEKLKESFFNEDHIQETQTKTHELPANYVVCMALIEGIKRAFKSMMRQGGGVGKHATQERSRSQEFPLPFPPVYATLYYALQLMLVLFLQVTGFGFIRARNFIERKQKHTWAVQVLDELLSQADTWEYNGGTYPSGPYVPSAELHPDDPQMEPTGIIRAQNFIENKQKHAWAVQVLELLSQATMWGCNAVPYVTSTSLRDPEEPTDPEKSLKNLPKVEMESPILVAAKMGVKEMVQKILDVFPLAIRDVNQDGKNVVLLAVENRQPSVFSLLNRNREKFAGKVRAFQQVDRDGNTVFHLAATCKPWLIPGAALQMQSEIKWYQFVKKSLPNLSVRSLNRKGQTDKAVFIETHKDLVKEGGVWLNSTSQSCSVVAALVATVAFATVAAIPGSDKHETANSTSADKTALEVFSIASLVALCFSVASLITFLAVLTSGYEEAGFYARLTAKLIFGLTSLFISMASMLISFFASLSFVFKYQLNIQIFTVYSIAILPVAFSAVALFPLYEYLIRSAFSKRPPRAYLRETSLISSIE